MASNLLNFLRDSQAQSEMRNALTDAANRGMVAGSLGAPVDMATTVANLLIAGGGYAGHKMGLLSQPPELIESRNVPGSSEWIGKKMQNAGVVSPNRNALAEFGMGLLSPVAYKGAQKAGGLLYKAETNALANLAKPSTMVNAKQRGVIEWPGSPSVLYHGSAKPFDRFDPNKLGANTGADDASVGFHFADNAADADLYASMAARAQGLESGHIGRFDVSMKRPLVVSPFPEDGNIPEHMIEGFLNNKISAADFAKANGYDGLIYPHGTNVDSGYTAIAFTPDQILKLTKP